MVNTYFGLQPSVALNVYNTIRRLIRLPAVERFVRSRGTVNINNQNVDILRQILINISNNDIGEEVYTIFPRYTQGYDDYVTSGYFGNVDYLIMTLFWRMI